MIYRASIAKEVFGTDDAAEIENIVGAGSGNWDKFWEAAATLKEKGYAVVSGSGDMWNVCEKSATEAWIKDGQLNIAPERDAFLDIAKKLKDEGLSNDASGWTEAWYADMKGEGAKGVFCFFGPAWLINYVMIGNCGGTQAGEGTYGDWRVCAPPVGFFWGGTWVLGREGTTACQAPLSMGFSRQEYSSGLPCPPFRGFSPPRDLTCLSYVSCIGRCVLYH